jgi:hypothetical protein
MMVTFKLSTTPTRTLNSISISIRLPNHRQTEPRSIVISLDMHVGGGDMYGNSKT